MMGHNASLLCQPSRRPSHDRSSGLSSTLTRRLPGGMPCVLLIAVCALGGCTTAGDVFHLDDVKPWERDVLAREDMQLSTDAMDDAVDDHLYFSKEASTGGRGVRGGGCGCN